MDNYTRYHSLLNKHDVVPLYAQLEKMLRGDILSGIFGAGDLIPSETVLSRDLGITRTTVRKAFEILAKDGLVEQIRGKGTVVMLQEAQPQRLEFLRQSPIICAGRTCFPPPACWKKPPSALTAGSI